MDIFNALLILGLAMYLYRLERDYSQDKKRRQLNQHWQQPPAEKIDSLVIAAMRRGMPRRIARAHAHQLRTGGKFRQKGHHA